LIPLLLSPPRRPPLVCRCSNSAYPGGLFSFSFPLFSPFLFISITPVNNLLTLFLAHQLVSFRVLPSPFFGLSHLPLPFIPRLDILFLLEQSGSPCFFLCLPLSASLAPAYSRLCAQPSLPFPPDSRAPRFKGPPFPIPFLCVDLTSPSPCSLFLPILSLFSFTCRQALLSFSYELHRLLCPFLFSLSVYPYLLSLVPSCI